MQTNANGQIAVKRLRQNQKLVKINKEKFYVFAPKHNVCLAWVDPEDLDFILSLEGGCCGGKKKEFWLATSTDVRRHLHGGR